MSLSFLDGLVSAAIIARICNDDENYLNYSVVGEDCFYLDEKVGTVTSKFNLKSGVLDIYFKPIKGVEYITIDFTISKTGAGFK